MPSFFVLGLFTESAERANQLVEMAVSDYATRGSWQCGLPAEATTPGLMCGLAGIGYGLLRAVDPARIRYLIA